MGELILDRLAQRRSMQSLCYNRFLCLLFRKDTKPQLLNNNLQYLTKARSQINAPQLCYKPKAIPP